MSQSFLQSKSWEGFQNSLGRKTFWIDDRLVIKMPMVLGQSYLYSARCSFKNIEELKQFLEKTKKIGKTENAFFIRFEPENFDFDIDKLGLKKVNSRQPEDTLMVNLNCSLEEILAAMKPKCRYNINLAKKKDVKIEVSTDPKDIDIFYNIAEETARRDKIRFFPKDYYELMAKSLTKNGFLVIYFARYENRYLAASVMLMYDDTAIYLHGASTDRDRNIMAPYFLQWQAIEDAKKAGKKYYDFWGISPLAVEDTRYKIQDTNHAWEGISRFKMGFAPTEKTGIYRHYPGCYEESYGKKRYFVYSMFKKVM